MTEILPRSKEFAIWIKDVLLKHLDDFKGGDSSARHRAGCGGHCRFRDPGDQRDCGAGQSDHPDRRRRSAAGRGVVANWGGIQEKTQAVWAVIEPIFKQLVGSLQMTILPVLPQSRRLCREKRVLPALAEMGTTTTTALIPVLQQLGEWVVNNVLPALGQLGKFFVNTFCRRWSNLRRFVVTMLTGGGATGHLGHREYPARARTAA